MVYPEIREMVYFHPEIHVHFQPSGAVSSGPGILTTSTIALRYTCSFHPLVWFQPSIALTFWHGGCFFIFAALAEGGFDR